MEHRDRPADTTKTHESVNRDERVAAMPSKPLFSLNDGAILLLILLISGIVAGLPDPLDADYPYATALFSVFTTIAQILAPLLAVVLGLRIWRVTGNRTIEDSTIDRTLRRGLVLLPLPLLLSVAMLPVAELIRPMVALRQGIIAGVILLTLFAIVDLVGPFVGSLFRRSDQ